ncbi:Flp family type IVb pilin [Myxococcota bacterium]|nr:Flp family type IVb pilin [Myxococcota bacterium]
MRSIQKLVREEKGAVSTEYTVLLALVALALIVVAGDLATKIESVFASVIAGLP